MLSNIIDVSTIYLKLHCVTHIEHEVVTMVKRGPLQKHLFLHQCNILISCVCIFSGFISFLYYVQFFMTTHHTEAKN